MLVFVGVWAAGVGGAGAAMSIPSATTCLHRPQRAVHPRLAYCHSQTWNFVSWAISAEMGLYLALPLLFWITGAGGSSRPW
jgi:peptidoglycan/LPS O-acetylase OafA/YrhL